MEDRKTISLAITGASGAQYGLRLLECLLAADCQVYLMISKAAEQVIATETELELPDAMPARQRLLTQSYGAEEGQLLLLDLQDWFSPPASGSSTPTSMVICPASGSTLSAIAHGASKNLIERAADVALKERRKLIVVPREMPYSEVHLQNMLTLTRMGAVVMPASPGFYHLPTGICDLIDFVVGRILDHLDIEQSIMPRWGE